MRSPSIVNVCGAHSRLAQIEKTIICFARYSFDDGCQWNDAIPFIVELGLEVIDGSGRWRRSAKELAMREVLT